MEVARNLVSIPNSSNPVAATKLGPETCSNNFFIHRLRGQKRKRGKRRIAFHTEPGS